MKDYKYVIHVITEQGIVFTGSVKMCSQVYDAVAAYQQRLNIPGAYVLIAKGKEFNDG